MDSELEERKLSSIRQPQILFIYRKGGVGNPETFGQIACSVWRLPIRFTVGTGGTIIFVSEPACLHALRVAQRQ